MASRHTCCTTVISVENYHSERPIANIKWRAARTDRTGFGVSPPGLVSRQGAKAPSGQAAKPSKRPLVFLRVAAYDCGVSSNSACVRFFRTARWASTPYLRPVIPSLGRLWRRLRRVNLPRDLPRCQSAPGIRNRLPAPDDRSSSSTRCRVRVRHIGWLGLSFSSASAKLPDDSGDQPDCEPLHKWRERK